jgi:beta-lactam-binding protein with PASTA domain
MTVTKIALMIRCSMLLIAAATLAACGGNGSGGSVSVPNVVGDTQAAAGTAITGAGLTVGTVTTQSSSTVASGDVILEDPAAGTNVGSGTAVALFVSSGPATPVVISGTVASGTALTGTVSVYDSSASTQPRSSGGTIGTAGQYSVTVTGFTAPFLIQATGQVGGQGPTVTLYSVATAAGTVNITPITTLIALNMATGNLQSLMTGSAGNLPSLKAADLGDQNTNMDALLSSVLTAEGLSATYNFSTTPFTVGGAGYDRLLDNVTINSTTATAVTVTNITAPTAPITIDTAKGSPSGVLDITNGPATLPAGTLGSVSVPNVVGDTQAAAGTAITGAGLTVGTVTQAASATVASGEVISENPAAGASAASGSAVALVVSTGPQTGPQTYTIGGTVIGLKNTGTVHVLNGNDNDAISANGSFTLPTAVASGAAFTVSVGALPTGQVCAVQNGSGTVANANVTNVLVYCTYTQSVATLNGSYDGAGYNINIDTDLLGIGNSFDGAGNEGNTATFIQNVGGTVTTGTNSSSSAGPYTVVTTNAIPVLTDNGNNVGAIAGADSDEFFWLADAIAADGGGLPALAVWVNPLQNGTFAALAGNWFVAGLEQGSDPSDFEGVLTFGADGSLSGTSTGLDVNGVVSANPQSGPAGTLTVTSSGQFSDGASQLGYFSANGEFLVATRTSSGEPTGLTVAVKEGTGVTLATLNGVYTVGSLAFNTATTGDGEVYTYFFDGAGNWSANYIENDNGTFAAESGISGTYSVTSTGVLTLTNSGTGESGNVHTGGVSADGNIIVAANLTGGGAEAPRIYVGFRQ